jgi:tRNA A37 threonylcarbamoyladenosine modification protein TsaB
LHKKIVDILIIPISTPNLIGIYENDILIKTIKQEGKSSDILPAILQNILKEYELRGIFYVNGPGSFMAIKIAYVLLKAVSILKNIPLFATNGFYFNKNSPIKAIGKSYFIKKDDKITIQKINDSKIELFALPKVLDKSIFSNNSKPLYVISAI